MALRNGYLTSKNIFRRAARAQERCVVDIHRVEHIGGAERRNVKLEIDYCVKDH